MKKNFKKSICFLLAASMIFTPCVTSYANTNFEKETLITSNNQVSNLKIYDDGIEINGKFYTKEEFSELLNQSEEIPLRQERSVLAVPLASGAYLVPGVGEVLITATGLVIIGGATVAAGTWIANKIVSYFKEHTKNKRKSTHDKHTKPRPGRTSEKKKDPKKGWKPKNPKKNQPPKKGKKH